MNKDPKNRFVYISFFSLNIENVEINYTAIVWVIIALVLLVIVLYSVYRSRSLWGFKLRKRFRLNFSKNTSEDRKRLARILFIDDRDIPVAQSLEDDNWTVLKVRDVQIDDEKVKSSNIIFVDWKGVGRKISSEDEGIALAANLKRKYGSKKYIILYSAREYKKPEGVLADDWINKGSDFSTYLETIQKATFALFG